VRVQSENRIRGKVRLKKVSRMSNPGREMLAGAAGD
jgi:hypothetical protein